MTRANAAGVRRPRFGACSRGSTGVSSRGVLYVEMWICDTSKSDEGERSSGYPASPLAATLRARRELSKEPVKRSRNPSRSRKTSAQISPWISYGHSRSGSRAKRGRRNEPRVGKELGPLKEEDKASLETELARTRQPRWGKRLR